MTDPEIDELVGGAKTYEALFVPALFGQWAKIVADNVYLAPGQRVLDVACGTGVLSREILSRLEGKVHITGLDPNSGMLSVAKELSHDINWEQGSAEDLPFPDNSFDVVVCQFGLMFFSNREKAIQEIIRVLKPDGHMGFAVWDALENIPAYSRSVALIEQYAGSRAREALSGPYELGNIELLRQTFSDAGVTSTEVNTHVGTARFPDLNTMIEADLRGWLHVLGIILEEDEIQEILKRAQVDLGEFICPDGQVIFDLAAHIVTSTSS
jgi:ubiquinone/menaquinone biosynthesis C-methylase UbiE